MKRATKTRLKIRQRAVEASGAGDLELPMEFGKQNLENLFSETEFQQQPRNGAKRKLAFPDEEVPISPKPKVEILPKELVLDSIDKINILKNASTGQISNVERLIVRRLYPETFEDKPQLKKRFFRNPLLLWETDDKDKEANEIRLAFEYFWVSLRLKDFSAGTTLELEDCFIRSEKHMYGTKFDTLIVNYSDELVNTIKLPVLSLNPPKNSLLERIIVGRNTVIDCTGLNIETLVCMNILSYGDTLFKAVNVRKLILLQEMNPVRDADPERGDMVVEFPLPNGVHTVFIPEAQEFRYDHYSVVNSNLQYVGIIPSAYYPGRMTVGIQKTWQPIHRESLEQDFVNLIRNT